ncbi:hypothetical protein KC963_00655 [Candidatus Saccharibacteria bacterium]|nr:hypothetical protein [Candidatus Saccharibacteria bacterium]
MKMTIGFVGVVVLILAVLWVFNFVKLTLCDFESPWQCEAIHGIGLFPPVQVISVWFGTDEE